MPSRHATPSPAAPAAPTGRDGVAYSLPRLIGLGGFARSGKDTVADALARLGGYRRVAFADPLYEILDGLDVIVQVSPMAGLAYRLRPYRRLNVLVSRHGWGWVKRFAPQGRALVNSLGSGVRGFDEQFWIRAAMSLVSDDGRVVVTDCRFPAEADAVKAAGGRFVRVSRPGVGPGVDPRTGKPSLYETSMADYAADETIVNDREGLDLLDEAVAASLARMAGVGGGDAHDWVESLLGRPVRS